MGIRVDYDMLMSLKGNQEQLIRTILKKRRFCLLDPSRSNHDGSGPRHMETAIKIVGNPDDRCLYLCLDSKRNGKKRLTEVVYDYSEEEKAKCISYPSIDEVVELVRGKELHYNVSYFGGKCGQTECTINNTFSNRILLLDEKISGEVLWDEWIDIRIFLKSVDDAELTEKYMKPIDVRNLDINADIVNRLEDIVYAFDKDALIAKYAAVSEVVKAQYFVTRFHSNPLWSLNPICVLKYRISAYVLPAGVSDQEAAEHSEKKRVRESITGEQYIIDSIYHNSDICYDKEELYDLIGSYYYIIAVT